MSAKIRILHMSSTPIVGAMGKLSYLLSQNGYDSVSLVFKDYGADSGLSTYFLDNSVVYDENIKECILDYAKSSDIIWVHNLIPDEFYDILGHCTYKSKFVYHCHSFNKEPPLFYDPTHIMPVKFCKKLAVAQFQPRFFQDYTIVPNIITYKPYLKLKEDKELLTVIYSPSNKKPFTKYGNKYSSSMGDELKFLASSNKIRLIYANQVRPNNLFALRRLSAHVTIDEIVSGGYHQVSLEGLCAGNVVINNADFFAQMNIKQIAGVDEMPFYICDESNFFDRLNALREDNELVRRYQRLSYDFFTNYLSQDKLFAYYDRICKQVLEE